MYSYKQQQTNINRQYPNMFVHSDSVAQYGSGLTKLN